MKEPIPQDLEEREAQDQARQLARRLRELAEEVAPLHAQALKLPSHLESDRRSKDGEEDPRSFGWDLAAALEEAYSNLSTDAEILAALGRRSA